MVGYMRSAAAHVLLLLPLSSWASYAHPNGGASGVAVEERWDLVSLVITPLSDSVRFG